MLGFHDPAQHWLQIVDLAFPLTSDLVSTYISVFSEILKINHWHYQKKVTVYLIISPIWFFLTSYS